MPVNLSGEIGAGEKDLGLKTSDLGLTSDIGLRTIVEVGSLISGVSGAGNKSSEVLSPMSSLSLAS